MGLLERKSKSTLNAGSMLEEFLFIVSDFYIIPIPTNAPRLITVKYAQRIFEIWYKALILKSYGPHYRMYQTSLPIYFKCSSTIL